MTGRIIPPGIIRNIMTGKGEGDEAGKHNYDLDPVLDATIAEAITNGTDLDGIENRLEYLRKNGMTLLPIYEKQLIVAERLPDYDPEAVQDNTPVASLPLPPYIIEELQAGGINTVADLRSQSGQNIASNPKVGHEGIGMIRSAFIGTAFASIFSDDVRNGIRKGARLVSDKVKSLGRKHKRKSRNSHASTHEEISDDMPIEEVLGEGHRDIAEKLHEKGIETLHALLHASLHETGLTLTETRSVRTLLGDYGVNFAKADLPAPTPFDEA